MAYCPLGRGDLIGHPAVAQLARKHAVAPAAIAIAFLLSKPGVIAIPKSSHAEHVNEIAAARDVTFDAQDFAFLDREFPAPKRKTELEIV